MVEDCKYIAWNICGECGKGSVCGVHFQKPISHFADGYTSGDFQESKKLLDNGCPQVEKEIDYDAMGLKWYLG